MRSRRTPCQLASLAASRGISVRESSRRYPARLKYCTARSCFCAAARDENVPRFFRFPVFPSFLREYKRYSPDCNLRIMEGRCRPCHQWLTTKQRRWSGTAIFSGCPVTTAVQSLSMSKNPRRVKNRASRVAINVLEPIVRRSPREIFQAVAAKPDHVEPGGGNTIAELLN